MRHWSLWSASQRKLNDSRITWAAQFLWLAVVGIGFALIGGLPGCGLAATAPDHLQPNLLQLVWVFCILATLRWVPEDHNSAAIFYIHVLVGGLATDGIYRGGWRSLTLVYVMLMFPMLDVFVGTDTRAPPPKDQLNSRAFRLASLVQPVIQLVFLIWACAIIAYGNDFGRLSWWELVGSAISFGTYTGAIGITYAHELCHRHAKLDQWLGVMNLVLVCYPHFNIEHSKGHHKLIATEEDPATARAGESFYQFLPRVIVGELRSAAEIESRRLRKAGKPALHPQNELVRLFSASAAAALVLGAIFGGQACLFFCLQCGVAVLLFESVNYLEHYGLERRLLSDDVSIPVEWRYESVGVRHSWDSPSRLLNTFLLKLQRHADHHVHAGKRFQQLASSDSSPQLPGGYATMIILALIPPLWFAVMDPRLIGHRRSHPRQHYRHWPLGMMVPAGPTTLTKAGIKGAGRVIISGQRWGRGRLFHRRFSDRRRS
jgi:alkane 1-monooxygenase